MFSGIVSKMQSLSKKFSNKRGVRRLRMLSDSALRWDVMYSARKTSTAGTVVVFEYKAPTFLWYIGSFVMTAIIEHMIQRIRTRNNSNEHVFGKALFPCHILIFYETIIFSRTVWPATLKFCIMPHNKRVFKQMNKPFPAIVFKSQS